MPYVSIRPVVLVVIGALAMLLAGTAPARGEAPAAAISEPAVTPLDRDHWSWRELVPPPLPTVKNAAWCSNAVDRFILARLEAEGLVPSPQADRLTLIRRVTYDLTGISPSAAEADAFAGDDSPDAYERLVDRLLTSPAYAEHWAQHWLDLARYADSDGFEHDKLRPTAWRYRDWVIDAFNADMPYDEFVSLQIAGDELRPGDAAAAVATGFCLAGPDMPDINSQDERRHMVQNELASTVGAVFLALQTGCAQCHDHKFDPVSQADFYRLRAFFEPAVPLAETTFGRTLSTKKEDRPKSYLWIRGDHRQRGPEVSPAFVRIANPSGDAVPAEPDGTGTRSALARWLTQPDHPLTSRVIVNRIWQHDFGRGLSTTPSDFGLMGDEPEHPELLNYLAVYLSDAQWSLKRLHRLLLTSATYRQASRPIQEADRENLYWSRARRKRLDAESIRDRMLAAAGLLNARRGGPGVMTPLPKEVVVNTVALDWKPTPDVAEHNRRSVYLFVRRSLRHPLLEVFDRPDSSATCSLRARSTTAPQALTLLHSSLSLDCARSMAGQAWRDAPDDSRGRAIACFRRALVRPPDEEEVAWMVEFLDRQQDHLRQASAGGDALLLPESLPESADRAQCAALAHLCLALLNLNEFLYVD